MYIYLDKSNDYYVIYYKRTNLYIYISVMTLNLTVDLIKYKPIYYRHNCRNDSHNRSHNIHILIEL